MTQVEYIRLKSQIAVLEEIMPIYAGRTLDNIVINLKARVREMEKERL